MLLAHSINAQMSTEEKIGKSFHIALLGEKVAHDYRLVDALRKLNHVSLISKVGLDSEAALLDLVNVLVIACEDRNEFDILFSRVKKLTTNFRHLRVVLVNGGLTQNQVVIGFRQGIRDYFRTPYDTELLVERIQYLCTANLIADTDQLSA